MIISGVDSTINLKKQQSYLQNRRITFGDISNEETNDSSRLKSALKFGGGMAFITIASDFIFFNKNWRGKGKLPTIVNSVLDGAAIGVISAFANYAGFCKDNKTNKADTFSAPQEYSTILPDKEKTDTFAGRMKSLGIFGATFYLLSSGIELAVNKFNNIKKILGKNALITTAMVGIIGAVTEGIKYYKDKKANQQ